MSAQRVATAHSVREQDYRGISEPTGIRESDAWPACAPVKASPTRLPVSAHDSGSRWFAVPFLCGSCIRYSLLALNGTFKTFREFLCRIACGYPQISGDSIFNWRTKQVRGSRNSHFHLALKASNNLHCSSSDALDVSFRSGLKEAS
jgi:hypothetical protein